MKSQIVLYENAFIKDSFRSLNIFGIFKCEESSRGFISELVKSPHSPDKLKIKHEPLMS